MYDLGKIRDSISPAQVVAYFDEITSSGYTHCLWHPDENPSMYVYENGLHCFSCGQDASIFDYVQERLGLGFKDAVEWLIENSDVLPEDVTIVHKRSSYKGPVPRCWIEYWHHLLNQERRQYLHQRGIEDRTIDYHQLGYSPDKQAYVIPFWRGIPGLTDVDIIQYRASPWYEGDKRYWSEEGYNKPSVINEHLINPVWVVLVFGTIDAILGGQLGLPMLGLNGTNAFLDPDRPETQHLLKRLEDTGTIYILPDTTPVEAEPAERLALLIGDRAQVRYFPRDMDGKDFNDYMLAGGSVEDFMEKILYADRTFIYVVNHRSDILDILGYTALGKKREAEDGLKFLLSVLGPIDLQLILHSMAIACYELKHRIAFGDSPIVTRLKQVEWEEIAQEISDCKSRLGISWVLSKWADIVNDRKERMGF